MSNVREITRSKVDYRIVQIAENSPSTEVRATVILEVPPSEEVVREISQLVNVEKVFNFMFTVKVRGKAREVVKLSEKPFVKYIMMDEIVVKTEEWI
ncbi:MAG: hypothetical protein MPF33_00915 [Candidatus Aramenus sp.]|jgi:hypothetical protein|nr:hypothetical protein [Candidatus Aramenus sp.]